ncbi:MAG: hypothetical protein ACOYL5_04065 [Phototrophicaceae bacterium]|jgi:RNA polymerase-binding transcription factor DksA
MSAKKQLSVNDYQRTIQTRTVAFICAECGQDIVEERFPGPTPRYCLTCVEHVRRRQAKERKRRQRGG